MSSIIMSNRGGSCGICLQNFDPQNRPVTHRGGEGHEGFHKICLADWLSRHPNMPTCPYDKTVIDLSSNIFLDDPECLSLITMRMMKNKVQPLNNAAYAAGLGGGVALVAGTVAAGAVTVFGASGAASPAGAAGVTAAMGLAASVMVPGLGGLAFMPACGFVQVAVLNAGITGIAAMVTGVAAVGTAVLAGIGSDWILNQREVDLQDRECIGLGVGAAALVGLVTVGIYPLAVIPNIVLIGGAVSGVLSRWRR